MILFEKLLDIIQETFSKKALRNLILIGLLIFFLSNLLINIGDFFIRDVALNLEKERNNISKDALIKESLLDVYKAIEEGKINKGALDLNIQEALNNLELGKGALNNEEVRNNIALQEALNRLEIDRSILEAERDKNNKDYEINKEANQIEINKANLGASFMEIIKDNNDKNNSIIQDILNSSKEPQEAPQPIKPQEDKKEEDNKNEINKKRREESLKNQLKSIYINRAKSELEKKYYNTTNEIYYLHDLFNKNYSSVESWALKNIQDSLIKNNNDIDKTYKEGYNPIYTLEGEIFYNNIIKEMELFREG